MADSAAEVSTAVAAAAGARAKGVLMRSLSTRWTFLSAVGAVLASAGLMSAQQAFDSPDAAANALIQAASNNDTAEMQRIFGPQGQRILTSGNTEQDQAERAEFSRLAAQQHKIEIDPRHSGRALLSVGAEDWPFPAPLVRDKNGKWSFDAAAGAMEMRARRVGSDELDAIEICAGYVQAQKQYAARNQSMPEYALHVRSSPGTHDGLYWQGDPAPLVPGRFAESVWNPQQPGRPYHGYYFSVLTSQGADAPGGRHSYVVNGRLVGGFGLVAWPAQYGVTGVRSFIVNQEGMIYEKDLGPPQQGKVGPPVTTYNPGRSWMLVDE